MPKKQFAHIASNHLMADCITARNTVVVPVRSVTIMSDYNGWKNRSTWNVALWIQNDENIYNGAVEFMKDNPDAKNPYKAFIISCGLSAQATPDRIHYISGNLDYKALNEMMKELME
jgi:hypothetical protein